MILEGKWLIIFMLVLLFGWINLSLSLDSFAVEYSLFNMFCAGFFFGSLPLCYFGFKLEKFKLIVKGDNKIDRKK